MTAFEPSDPPNPDMDKLMADIAREQQIVGTLPESLPILTKFVIAQDIRSGQDWLERFHAGEATAEQAIYLTGSFARLDVALTLRREGAISDDWFFAEWPHLWRSSDPDDTDPRFWDIWVEAFGRKGSRIYDDPDHELPGKGTRLTVYRGQRIGDKIGCAWTTDRAIAIKFATGAGHRCPITDGRVLRVTIPKGLILAYLTGRGESECVIDPRHALFVKP